MPNAVAITMPDYTVGNYSMLVDDPLEYSSGMFESLKYTDLKKSYTNTLIDISDVNFNTMRKPQTIDQLIQDRSEVPPISITDSKTIFSARDKLECDSSTHRAYTLCKQLESSQIKNARMTGDFYKIVLK
jgi:hypothetical protein